MTAENSYIEVAVAIPVYHTFTYSVPQFLQPFVAAGKRVLVPFGQRRVTGYILGPSQDSGTAEIKNVLDVLDEHPLFASAMIQFFQWISDYYKYPIGEVIKNALPGGLTLNDYASIAITPEGKRVLKSGAINPLERAVLKLLDSGPCRLNQLSRKLKQVVPAAFVQSLQRSGYILKTRELRDASIKTRQERFSPWRILFQLWAGSRSPVNRSSTSSVIKAKFRCLKSKSWCQPQRVWFGRLKTRDI